MGLKVIHRMTRCNSVLRILLAIALINTSLLSFAEEQSIEELINSTSKKSDRNYASFGFAMNEFRSIDLILVSGVQLDRDGEIIETFRGSFFPLTAQTYATSFAFGTYLTEHFKTEVRYGMGIRDDTLKGAMDININYWLNWYIGATYPVTDYMSAYGMYGVSHYDADVTRREIKMNVIDNQIPKTVNGQPSRLQMEEDLFGTSFSTSWLLGLDFGLGGPWYLAFEYGRLLRDTDTNIKVYQAGTYLRYEF